MATITAAKSGSWSDTSVWAGGVVPGSVDPLDVADMGGYNVTGDQNITCARIQNGAAGGTFIPVNGMTYTASFRSGKAGIYMCTVANGVTCTITVPVGGNINNTAATCYTILVNSGGVLTINGADLAGAYNYSITVNGTVHFNTNYTGSGYGMNIGNSGIVNFNGAVQATGGTIVTISGTGTLNFNPNAECYSSGGGAVVYLAAGTMNWTNQTVTLSAGRNAYYSLAAGTLNMTGLQVMNSGTFVINSTGTTTITTTGMAVINQSAAARAAGVNFTLPMITYLRRSRRGALR